MKNRALYHLAAAADLEKEVEFWINWWNTALSTDDLEKPSYNVADFIQPVNNSIVEKKTLKHIGSVNLCQCVYKQRVTTMPRCPTF